MIDYKDRYWDILTKPGLGQHIVDQLMDAALRQLSAAGQRRVRWYFSEEESADFVRKLFEGDPIRGRIEIVHVRMPEIAR